MVFLLHFQFPEWVKCTWKRPSSGHQSSEVPPSPGYHHKRALATSFDTYRAVPATAAVMLVTACTLRRVGQRLRRLRTIDPTGDLGVLHVDAVVASLTGIPHPDRSRGCYQRYAQGSTTVQVTPSIVIVPRQPQFNGCLDHAVTPFLRRIPAAKFCNEASPPLNRFSKASDFSGSLYMK